MKPVKIVTIGGGSSYTPELIEGLINRYDQMPIRELWLVDIEAGRQKLDIISAMAKRMVKKANLDFKIYATTNRREALVDADFITTQFRVGQLDARYLDESIPAKYGLVGQETNGAGGMMKALRTIPVIFEIIEDARELAPEAWIINFTNPAGLITEAVLNHANWPRFVGVCNVPYHTERMIADLLGVQKQEVQIKFAGLNHLVFGLDIFLNGKSIKRQVLDELLPNAQLTMKNIMDIPWSMEFLKGLDMIPCSYHRYYFQKEEMLEHLLVDYKNHQTRAEVVKDVEHKLFEQYKEEQLDYKPEELAQRGGAHYSDVACNLIVGIYTNNQTVQTVNTRNNGAISSLPDEVAVEINCVITSEGPQPIAVGALPPAAQGIVSQIKAFEQLTIKAALSGRYEDAFVALAINPLMQSEKLTKLVLDEMLIANKDNLPQFKQAIEKLEHENHH